MDLSGMAIEPVTTVRCSPFHLGLPRMMLPPDIAQAYLKKPRRRKKATLPFDARLYIAVRNNGLFPRNGMNTGVTWRRDTTRRHTSVSLDGLDFGGEADMVRTSTIRSCFDARLGFGSLYWCQPFHVREPC